MQKKLDKVLEIPRKRISQVHTFVDLEKCLKTDGQNVRVSNFVFNTGCSAGKMLFHFPTSTSKNFQMRKTNTAVLKHHLTTDVS